MKINYLFLLFLISGVTFYSTSCQKQIDFSGDIDSLRISVQNLNKRIDSLVKALNTTNSNLANLGSTVDSIKIQLSFISSQITILTSQMNDANANISQIQTQLALLNQMYLDLQNRLNNLLNSVCSPCYSLSNGLLAYYPFTGNANDSSGNGNNGIVQNAVLAKDRFGIENRAYSFNGVNQYIQVADNITLEPSNAISLSAWVYIDSSASNNTSYNFQRFISKEHSIAQNYASYQLITGNSGLDSLGYPGFTIRTTSGYTWTGHSGVPLLNNWIHICGTWDGQNIKFYQNGNLVKTQLFQGTLIYDSGLLLFGKGRNGNGSDLFFKGKLDEVRIYNRALSQSEITYLSCH